MQTTNEERKETLRLKRRALRDQKEAAYALAAECAALGDEEGWAIASRKAWSLAEELDNATGEYDDACGGTGEEW